MKTPYSITSNLNRKSEMIKHTAIISFDEMEELLEPITSCEDVMTIAIKYRADQKYNTHHTIVPSVNPESQKGFDGAPDFYLISNPKNATREIQQLNNILTEIDLIIVLVELEEYHKFSVTFTLPVFVKHIQTLCPRILCVAKEPFHFTGARRKQYSDECLTKLLKENIPVIAIDVHKFFFAMPCDMGWRDATTLINSIVSTITYDLFKHLRQVGGWEALLEIVQKSSNSQIYFDITKRARDPQNQFIYTIFGRCNAPALIESMPIEINIPTKEPIKKSNSVLSWIGKFLKKLT